VHFVGLFFSSQTQNINTYCFSTVTMIERTRLNVTLYMHYLSYLLYMYTLFEKPSSDTSRNFRRRLSARRTVTLVTAKSPEACTDVKQTREKARQK